METTLKEINAVLGVVGSFVCLPDGSIPAKAMPDRYDEAHLTIAARLANQTFQALETSGQRLIEVDLLFGQGRLVLKNLRGGVLGIVCARTINLPLLNLTANVAAKKLTAKLRPPKPAAAQPAETPAPAPTPTISQPVPGEAAPSLLFQELEKETQRISEAAQQARVILRMLNPLALWVCCPRSRALLAPPDKRQLDFAARSAESDGVTSLFEQLGYQSNRRFNAFYGNRRLNFVDAQRNLSVDVFIDQFEMYHRLDLTEFLTTAGVALPETALLLTRLQLVEIEDAGLREIIALLAEHDLSVGAEKEKIDASPITRLCADDWGWFKTVSLNLERVVTYVAATLPPSDQSLIAERVQRLKQSIDGAPKSLRWQTRSRLGESVRWYETPQGGRPSPRPDMALG